MHGCITQCIWRMLTTFIVYVAVPCRNRRLFRRVFRSHCCVQSAVSLNFREGRRSYALCKLIRYSCIYEAIKIRDGITFNFYTGLSHNYVFYPVTPIIVTCVGGSKVPPVHLITYCANHMNDNERSISRIQYSRGKASPI